MPSSSRFHAAGFTTIEVLVAMILISIALVALEATTTSTIRRIADSHRESIAADLARQQLDRVIATPCANGAGTDSSNGVALSWRVSVLDHIATVDQQIRYAIANGPHTDSLQATVPCR